MGPLRTPPGRARGRLRPAVALAVAGATVAALAVAGAFLHFGRDEEPPTTPQERAEKTPPEAPPLTIASLREEELDTAKRLLEDFPADPRALAILGDVYNRHGRRDEAIACWKRALAASPRDAAGYNAIAGVAFLREEHERAVELWRRAAAIDPDFPDVHYHLGQALLLMGKPDEALDELEKDVARRDRGLERSGLRARSHFLLGQIYSQRHDYEKARESFRAAIAADPNNVKAYYGLAMVEARLGNREAAQECMETFRRLKAADVERDKDARRSYDDLTVRRRQAAVTYFRCGEVYAAARRFDRAEALWRRALELDPESVTARSALATLYQGSGRLRDALKLAAELASLEPRNPLRQLNLGVLHARLGEFPAAVAAFRRVCVLAPDRPEGYRYLAQALLDGNMHLEEAAGAARRAVALDGSGASHFVLGRVLARLGDRNGALSALRRALELEPRNKTYQTLYERLRAGG